MTIMREIDGRTTTEYGDELAKSSKARCRAAGIVASSRTPFQYTRAAGATGHGPGAAGAVGHSPGATSRGPRAVAAGRGPWATGHGPWAMGNGRHGHPQEFDHHLPSWPIMMTCPSKLSPVWHPGRRPPPSCRVPFEQVGVDPSRFGFFAAPFLSESAARLCDLGSMEFWRGSPPSDRRLRVQVPFRVLLFCLIVSLWFASLCCVSTRKSSDSKLHGLALCWFAWLRCAP